MDGVLSNNEKIAATFVIDRFSTIGAGTEGQLHLLLCGLVSQGYSPVLFVLDGTSLVDTGGFPYEVRVVGRSSIKSIACWWRLFKVSRSERRRGSRLLHCFFNDCSVICPPIFSLCGFRVLISRRDMGFWYNSAYLRLLNITRRFVDGVVVNSRAVGDVTRVKEGYVQSAIHLIYNAYSKDPAESSEYLESKLGLKSNDDIRLVLVANLRPIKRIGDAIIAVSQLLAAGFTAQLFVVGAGDIGDLGSLAHQLKIRDRIHFLGSRDDIVDILQFMDVGLNCSESEGYSNAIVEYMYAGLPVVASDVGGNTEAVEDGVTGFLYRVGATDQLTAKLKLLANDVHMRTMLGQKGREIASSRHSPRSVIEQYLELYKGSSGS